MLTNLIRADSIMITDLIWRGIFAWFKILITICHWSYLYLLNSSGQFDCLSTALATALATALERNLMMMPLRPYGYLTLALINCHSSPWLSSLLYLGVWILHKDCHHFNYFLDPTVFVLLFHFLIGRVLSCRFQHTDSA